MPRIGRNPVAPPRRERRLAGVLHCVLRQLEISGLPDQRGQHNRSLVRLQHKANLDEGVMWPVAFALKELTPDVEARIDALVKKAVS